MEYLPLNLFVFAWSENAVHHPFLTAVVGTSWQSCKAEVEQILQQPWKRIYRYGGRIIPAVLTVKGKE